MAETTDNKTEANQADQLRQSKLAHIKGLKIGLQGPLILKGDYEVKASDLDYGDSIAKPLAKEDFNDQQNQRRASRAQHRENRQRAKQQFKNIRQEAKNKIPLVGARVTSRMLTWCWLNIIETWGVPIIWINIHWFLSSVAGEKYFCSIGHEWNEVYGFFSEDDSATGQTAKAIGDEIGYAEKSLIIFVDLIIIFLVILVSMTFFGAFYLMAAIGYLFTLFGTL